MKDVTNTPMVITHHRNPKTNFTNCNNSFAMSNLKMSKDQTTHDHKGEGAKLVGSPEKMIDLIIIGDKEKQRVNDQVLDY